MKSETGSDLDTALRVLGAVIFIGKHLLLIITASVLGSAAAAVISYATANVAATIFWIIITMAGIVFMIQVLGKRRAHRKRLSKRVTRREFAGAAEA